MTKFKDTISNDDKSVYSVGVGISDITGPAAELNMMGYGQLNQNTSGIHLRLFSRAYIIEDSQKNRIVYVTCDLCMISQIIKIKIIEKLKVKFGPDLYTEKNVCLSCTHTHSGINLFL